jgi:hypothetical protein
MSEEQPEQQTEPQPEQQTEPQPEQQTEPQPEQQAITEEEKEQTQEIIDCITLAISALTRASYLIQLDQIRVIYILNDDIRTRIDSIIIDEIEEILDDISIISPCEIFYYVDPEELQKLLEELGELDVNKAKIYGEHAWNIFSKLITYYVISTWDCRRYVVEKD